MTGRCLIGGHRQRDGASSFALRQARGPLIKRWIGAARRRADRTALGETDRSAEIIELTWEQTFGRPARPESPGSGHGSLTFLFGPRSCA